MRTTTGDENRGQPAHLYRIMTTTGELAYVGVTTRRVSDALRGHRHRARWWKDVNQNPHSVIVEAYATESEAIEAKASIIETERPQFNVHDAAIVRFTDRSNQSMLTALPGRAPKASGGQPGKSRTVYGGRTTGERINTRRTIEANAYASQQASQPAERQPGEWRLGDRVRWTNPFNPAEVIEGELVGDPAHGVWMVEMAGGSQVDIGSLDELTMITTIEDRQS